VATRAVDDAFCIDIFLISITKIGIAFNDDKFSTFKDETFGIFLF